MDAIMDVIEDVVALTMGMTMRHTTLAATDIISVLLMELFS